MTTTRTIGRSGREISAIGLGCMGLSEFYGPPTAEQDAVALLHAAIDLGVTHFDTAEMYGMGHNETLLGKAFAGRWQEVFFATKFGPLRDPATGAFTGVDGSPANVRRAVEGSLQRLGAETIDLYYLHRVDPATPIEETVGEMAKLVAEGKVRWLGLSEAGSDTIRRACAVHPITALQTEYSIFNRNVEKSILPVCRELGVSLVAYSPLGRGMLTGRFKQAADVATGGDYRGAGLPQFSDENFAANRALVDRIENVAADLGATAAQVALAWVLGRGDDVVTIPGTTKLANLAANLGAYGVHLDDAARAVLDELSDRVQGTRYPAASMRAVQED